MNNVTSRGGGQYLKLTKDRKVSPQGTHQTGAMDRWNPSIHNSFGLPAGDSCPGKTPFCESCYAVISEQSKGVRDAMQHNLRLLTEAGTVESMTHLLAEAVGRFTFEAMQKNLAPRDWVFRIHWDGDFFSEDYARAWAAVIEANSDVQFWAYTRSYVPPVNVVPILAGIPNLALYLSADEWNIERAKLVASEWPQVRLAICTVDYETGRKLADRKAIVCPENNGRMPLMKDGRGACVDCRLCPDARADVIFSTSHRERVSVAGPVIRKQVSA